MKGKDTYDFNNETIGYVRVSTREQQMRGYSVSDQVRDILNYAKELNLDLTEENIVVDSGRSAGTLKRPGIQELLRNIPSGNIKRIIVKNNSRLTRAQLDRYSLDCVFGRYNVAVLCLEGKWKGESVSEEMQTGVQVFFDEHLRKQVSPDTRRGMKESALQGNYSIGGTAPRGFQRLKNENGKGGGIAPVPEYEKYIIYIFEALKSREHTRKSLAKLYTRHRIMGKKWTDNDVNAVFNNTLVYGTFTKMGLEIENFCKPIITKKLFDEAHAAQQIQTRHPKYFYIYAGMVYCKNCQQYCVKECVDKKVGKKIKVYQYYLCKSCYSRINEKKLDAKVSFQIDLNAMPKEKFELINELSSKVENKTKRLRIIENDFDNDLMTESDFMESNVKIKKEIIALKKEIDKIMNTAAERYTKLSSHEKRKVAFKKIERIDVDFENDKKCILILKKNK